MKCLNCNKQTKNLRFCCRACSNHYTKFGKEKIVLDIKRVVKMYFYEGKTLKEISKIVGGSSPTIRKRLTSRGYKIRPPRRGGYTKEMKSPLRNKTYEEVYGKEKAKKLKKEISKFHKSKRKNKKYSKMVIKAQLKGLLKRPTSYEQKVSRLLVKYNLPFVYTGNGVFFIGIKNPDFINKEEKIAIEVYSNYFKIRNYGSCENYEKQRSEYFAKYGYKTIFIRDKEINHKNWENICLNKFQGNYNGR